VFDGVKAVYVVRRKILTNVLEFRVCGSLDACCISLRFRLLEGAKSTRLYVVKDTNKIR